MKSRILILDIETLPNMAFVWRFFKENIAPKQVFQNSELLSFAAKWYGSKHTIYRDVQEDTERAVLKHLLALLDAADIVVAHKGRTFDVPRIRARALVHGLKPPSPFKIVDTLEVAKKEFNFEGNSLEHLANVLNCTPKLAHKKFPGFEMWLECIKGNPEAFKECKTYNIGDVSTLEEIYTKMLPWISNHPNHGIYEDGEEIVCPKCGSKHLQKRGFYKTEVRTYQRFQCMDCGGWSRARLMEGKQKNVVVNAV